MYPVTTKVCPLKIGFFLTWDKYLEPWVLHKGKLKCCIKYRIESKGLIFTSFIILNLGLIG